MSDKKTSAIEEYAAHIKTLRDIYGDKYSPKEQTLLTVGFNTGWEAAWVHFKSTNQYIQGYEPKIWSGITDGLPEDHPEAHVTLYCGICRSMVHAVNNECMTEWVETMRGPFCLECFMEIAAQTDLEEWIHGGHGGGERR